MQCLVELEAKMNDSMKLRDECWRNNKYKKSLLIYHG